VCLLLPKYKQYIDTHMAYNMYHTQLAKAWTQVRLQQHLSGLGLACHAQLCGTSTSTF
jgi:hypothetical protein